VAYEKNVRSFFLSVEKTVSASTTTSPGYAHTYWVNPEYDTYGALTVEEIADIVRQYGVAAQIKLISLNASTEAARAGAHGRGFSVISSAIRSLAERTADITGQISRLQIRIKSSTEESDQTG
jgi:hypothetical protein